MSAQDGEIIPDVQLEDNTNQRTPCIVVCDGSRSMLDEGRIDRLNDGLKALEGALKEDPTARGRVQVAVLRFGERDAVETLTDWTDAATFTAPTVQANGVTPLGRAMDEALSMLETRKEQYKANGIPYTRPWLFAISDGLPSDDWEAAARRCVEAEEAGRVVVWPVGVGDADLDVLRRFTAAERGAIRLDAAQWTEMFLWLSRSLSAVSQSKEGDTVQLPAPKWTVQA